MLALAATIAIPTIAYLLIEQIVFHKLHLPSLLLFSNLIQANANQGLSYWFIEVYIQILLIGALVISLIPRKYISNTRQESVSIALIGLSLLSNQIGPVVWDTNLLYNRVPHMLLWFFAFGIGAQTLKSPLSKLILSVAFLAAVELNFGLETPYRILTYGGLLLIWLPWIKVPTILKSPISQVASASLFIYLSHFQFHSLSEKIFGNHAWMGVIFALVGGTITWKLYLACWSHIVRIRPSRKLRTQAKVTPPVEQLQEREKVLVRK